MCLFHIAPKHRNAVALRFPAKISATSSATQAKYAKVKYWWTFATGDSANWSTHSTKSPAASHHWNRISSTNMTPSSACASVSSSSTSCSPSSGMAETAPRLTEYTMGSIAVSRVH